MIEETLNKRFLNNSSKVLVTKEIVSGRSKFFQKAKEEAFVSKITNPHATFVEAATDKVNLNVETWADVDRKTYMCWGDYWVKVRLLKAFRELGFNVNVHPNKADVTIYLWGSPFPARKTFPYMHNPNHSYNVMWFYSNPIKMTKQEMSRYHLIFCLSENYLNEIKGWHPNIHNQALESCTDFEMPVDQEKDIDLLFVGNARGGLEYGRKAIYWLDVAEEMKIQIYGHKWHLPRYYDSVKKLDNWYAGQYWPYEKLNVLYNRSKITLVDGHQDMAEGGFVPMKIFDVIASGGFVISNYNTGISKIFGDSIPQYKTKNEMNRLIKGFYENEQSRLEFQAVALEKIKSRNFVETAKQIVEKLTDLKVI